LAKKRDKLNFYRFPEAPVPRAVTTIEAECTGHRLSLAAKARQHSIEFHPFMANHLPMILVALDRLGATRARLEAHFETYSTANRLVKIDVPANGCLDRTNWQNFLGNRSYESDFRAFFASEVNRLGPQHVQDLYLPVLAPGVAASALHALMRLAYANLTGDAAEVGVALAYWAAAYLPLGNPCAQVPTLQDPLDLLLILRSRLTRKPPKPDIDLLWHFMRAVAELPEFSPLPGSLIITSHTLSRLRRLSLALFASTMTFEALHAVTGCHWLRLLPPQCPALPDIQSAFWTAIVAIYPKIGMPLPLDETALDAMRHAPSIPNWTEIAAAAVCSDDEHDISLAFSARDEWTLTRDRLYQVVAAKRLGLI
jgi:hypothetical protein